MNTHSLVSIEDYSKEEILEVLKLASEFEANPNQRLLEGKVVASLFFEPSTRTRLSFETAINRLGGRIIGFTDASSSSVTKGETLKDTIKMVDNYADLIVMRHPVEGAARYASEVADIDLLKKLGRVTVSCSIFIPFTKLRGLWKIWIFVWSGI